MKITKLSFSALFIILLFLGTSWHTPASTRSMQTITIRTSQINVTNNFNSAVGSCTVNFYAQFQYGRIYGALWNTWTDDTTYTDQNNGKDQAGSLAAATESETGNQMANPIDHSGPYTYNRLRIRLKYDYTGGFCYQATHYGSWLLVYLTSDINSGGQYVALSSSDAGGSATYTFYILAS